MARNLWTYEEMVLVLALYHQLPFGKLDQDNKDVKELGAFIREHINAGRSNGAVAYRLTNYASCDPYIINSGRKGMPNGKKVCQPYWDKYENDKEALFMEADRIKSQYAIETEVEEIQGITTDKLVGLTKEAVVKIRVNQGVFRKMILNNYDNKCAITGIADSRFLIASHIIPWAENEEHRLNPENGICLSPLYDKAFDKGLISVRADDYTIILSRELKEQAGTDYYKKYFLPVENLQISLPLDHNPSSECLQYHYDNIFARHN